MTQQLTGAGADAGGVRPQISPDRHFTDDVSGITVAFVDLETFYRRNKAGLVFWVKSRNPISFEVAIQLESRCAAGENGGLGLRDGHLRGGWLVSRPADGDLLVSASVAA